MSPTFLLVLALVNLGSLVGFVLGFFLEVNWLLFICGSLLALDHALQILAGTMRPHFQVLLAVVLAIAISPWYVGVFWSVAALEVLNIPENLRRIIAPGQVARQIAVARQIDTAGSPDFPEQRASPDVPQSITSYRAFLAPEELAPSKVETPAAQGRPVQDDNP